MADASNINWTDVLDALHYTQRFSYVNTERDAIAAIERHRAKLEAVDLLLDALRALLTVYEHGECEAMHPDVAENMARAAIRAATGEES
jgi:ApbE superfamily uncharacterized protein (UPF0280 family)